MRIYFEDGKLRDIFQIPVRPKKLGTITVAEIDFIDAGNGITESIEALDTIKEINPDAVVYTNSIVAFDNRYAWDEALKVPDIYIRAGENMVFTRIDKLTKRDLKEGHNLAKMYIAGEFM